MATYKTINSNIKINNDTGFGNNPGAYGGRFINRDGSFNLTREGISFINRFSIYQKMLNLPLWKFICVIITSYFIINLVYTTAYLIIGSSQLQGIMAVTPWGKIKEVFYFSAETFTTVGYGRVNPMGDAANIVASIEAMSGFLSFAIATGLIYGRFAKPRSYLVFSDYALVSPYNDKTALMFRFATYKDNHALTNVEIKVTIALRALNEGKDMYNFYDLKLERYKVDNLPMNWTVVHPIDEESPLHDFTCEDVTNADVELYVLITGFDEVYSSPVQRRTSYTYQEMKFNAKFLPMYRESDDGRTTILELHKLNAIKELEPSNNTPLKNA